MYLEYYRTLQACAKSWGSPRFGNRVPHEPVDEPDCDGSSSASEVGLAGGYSEGVVDGRTQFVGSSECAGEGVVDFTDGCQEFQGNEPVCLADGLCDPVSDLERSRSEVRVPLVVVGRQESGVVPDLRGGEGRVVHCGPERGGVVDSGCGEFQLESLESSSCPALVSDEGSAVESDSDGSSLGVVVEGSEIGLDVCAAHCCDENVCDDRQLRSRSVSLRRGRRRRRGSRGGRRVRSCDPRMPFFGGDKCSDGNDCTAQASDEIVSDLGSVPSPYDSLLELWIEAAVSGDWAALQRCSAGFSILTSSPGFVPDMHSERFAYLCNKAIRKNGGDPGLLLFIFS